MAPTRPDKDSRQHQRKKQRPWQSSSGLGVKKRKKMVKRDGRTGPGRPHTWSRPWLKRLIVLRFCGLQFNEIFDLLSVLSKNTTPRIERTAQHNMQQLFGAGWTGLCASDKTTMKKRLRCVLESERFREKHKKHTATDLSIIDKANHKQLRNMSNSPQSFAPTWAAADPLERYTEDGFPSTLLPPAQVTHSTIVSDCTENVYTNNISVDEIHKRNFGAHSFSPSIDSRLKMIYNGHQNTDTDAFSDQDINFQPEIDNRSVAPSQSSRTSKISRILKTLGRTPSERSLIKRTLSLRYSFSSIDTSVCHSMSQTSLVTQQDTTVSELKVSENEHEVRRRADAHFLVRQQDDVQYINRALLQQCCSIDTSCIHRQIVHSTINTGAHRISLQCPPINTLLREGWDALFFAAHVGAPLHVLLTLIDHFGRGSNLRDKNGRTFLFYLDSKVLTEAKCNCATYRHKTAFMCLMLNLRNVGFDFQRLDAESKNFLDFLCLREHFRVDWVIDLVKEPTGMNDIIGKLSKSLDMFGLSFIDRLSTEDSRRFSYCFSVMRFASVWPFKNGSVRSQVYDLLSKNYDKHRQDDALLSLTTTLYYEGANMDCQSKSGETPLMLAVKHLCMKTVRFLLSKRVRTGTQNTSGWTALNFAMSNFNASRASKSSASKLAEALRLLMPLVDYGDQAKVSNISL